MEVERQDETELNWNFIKVNGIIRFTSLTRIVDR